MAGNGIRDARALSRARSRHPRRISASRAGSDGYVPAVRLGDLPEPQLGFSGPGVLGKRLALAVLKAASGPLPIPNSGTHPSAPALRLSWVDSSRRLRDTHSLRRYAARPLRPLHWRD